MILIVDQTNKYAAKVNDEKRRSGKMLRKSRDLLWHNTNISEMYCFLSLVILQGIVQKPSISSYYSRNAPIATPFFGKCIGRDRFHLLLKYLHFTEDDSKTEPTIKFKVVLDFLLEKFRTLYVPEQNISIDESLLLWKGRLKWKRYIPLKRSRFGIECYILAEAETGYVWGLIVYVGKNTVYSYNIPDMSEEDKQKLTKPTSIVLSLISPLLNKGYTLGIDNFYTSPELINILIAHKTDCIGTVRANRKHLCPEVKEKKLKKGELVAGFNNKVMHLKWKDKKYVNMLSTIYDDKMENIEKGNRSSIKPKVCIEYKKKHMGGVDLLDQVTSYNSCTRKGIKKYYKKF